MRIQPREKGDPKVPSAQKAAASDAGGTHSPGMGAPPAFHLSFGFERGEGSQQRSGWTSETQESLNGRGLDSKF